MKAIPLTTESNTSETTATDATSSSEPSNPCKRELTIEIPAGIVNAESESVVHRYQKLARIPGFRKGKVPASIVRQRFAEEIKNEIVEALVPRYFRQETQHQDLLPVSQPRVTDLHLHEGEPLKFTASFEVLPDFKVAPYEDLHIPRLDTNVSEEDVENALHNLRGQHATYSAVDEERPLMDGDFAVIGFKGTPKESEQNADSKPVEVDEVMVEIGGQSTIPEFTAVSYTHLR